MRPGSVLTPVCHWNSVQSEIYRNPWFLSIKYRDFLQDICCNGLFNWLKRSGQGVVGDLFELTQIHACLEDKDGVGHHRIGLTMSIGIKMSLKPNLEIAKSHQSRLQLLDVVGPGTGHWRPTTNAMEIPQVISAISAVFIMATFARIRAAFWVGF